MFEAKEIKLLIEFQKLTSQGAMSWVIIEPPASLVNATNDYIPNCYSTLYQNKTFIIYSRRYQEYSPEFDQMFFDERVEIAMIDWSGRILWAYADRTPALYDLFSIVKHQTSGIDDILNSF